MLILVKMAILSSDLGANILITSKQGTGWSYVDRDPVPGYFTDGFLFYTIHWLILKLRSHIHIAIL